MLHYPALIIIPKTILYSFVRFNEQLKAVAVNIDDFYIRIALEILAQFGDENVHRPGGEVVIFAPYFGQCF